MTKVTPDWSALREAAKAAAQRAYAPFSNYRVGAAAFTDGGRLVTGCNVENSSYGLGLCAECGLISELINTGGGLLTAFCCVNGAGDLITPCGRCRQLLYEHAASDLLIETPLGIVTINELLSQPFKLSAALSVEPVSELGPNRDEQ
ncbi:MAG: cytidine deaminase [Cellulomonadaceae bacterium]|nr:cytidine deaminase [Cellulomonadaceae bacterium]